MSEADYGAWWDTIDRLFDLGFTDEQIGTITSTFAFADEVQSAIEDHEAWFWSQYRSAYREA